MVEFGEKVKKLREEKGMTQQTMADQLYVTRQAVSRWECGARFPDLLTAKKIAQILEVSVDELLSGEELKKSIEKAPVLSAPMSNMIQTILYAVASAAYLLMLVFSLYSFFPAQALKGTPAGEITAVNVITVIGYLVNLCALAAGLVFSAQNSLSPVKTGAVMCTNYIVSAVMFLVILIDMAIRQNGHLGPSGWLDLFIPVLSAACILAFFGRAGEKLSPVIIYVIASVSFLELAQGFIISLRNMTDLGFAVKSVHFLGKAGLVALLVYQAYTLDRKRKLL
ncbi:helix-turn-helix transcriptional regulator [Eisenbergiella sp.]